MRLDKYLCDSQIGTRSQVKKIVKNGTVTVNGIIVKKEDFQIDVLHDDVTYKGTKIAYQCMYYYMLHKPAGIVTATKDNTCKTVMDLLIQAPGKNLFPVGRLDKDTEGLLLITNDGALSHALLSPKKHVEKTYYVQCTGDITPDKLSCLANGLEIGDTRPTLPAKVKLINADRECYSLELTITEGRFHQVKRMIHAIGGTVTYLKRVSMGTLMLNDLPKGAYRTLTDSELIALQSFQKE